MKNLNRLTIHNLVRLKAFSLQTLSPFVWGNGWKAPVYFDDRKILSYTQSRNFIKLELGRVVAELYPDVDVIAGIATNAIAHGVLVAEQLALPFVYVYPYPKDHGMENQIEGDLRPRQKVVIIENQVSLGDNSLRVIEALRASGCVVLGVVTIFDYEFSLAHERFSEAGVPLVALSTYSELVRALSASDYYSEDDLMVLDRWYQDPAHWSR